jgi:hypothetical protein
MQIVISKDASAIYVRGCYRGAHPACGMLHNPEWAEMLKKVEGQTLTVETEYLFKDQFNTAPIPGVSDLGMRIDARLVDKVIDDVRPGKIKSTWDGKIYDEAPTDPKHAGYLVRFVPHPNKLVREVGAHVWEEKIA